MPGSTTPFLDVLRGDPNFSNMLSYYSNLYGQNSGLSPNQKQYFGSPGVFDRYLNQYGAAAVNQGDPSLSFESYMSKNPFQQQWGQMSPDMRGQQQGRFAPPVRWVR